MSFDEEEREPKTHWRDRWYGGVVAGTIMFAIIISSVGVLSFALVSLIQLAERRDCRIVGERTGKVTHFEWYGGCYVKINGSLVPTKNWHVVEGERP